ncbi:Sialidase [Biscogniauxia marginata]|nr:Sialidase [Biscogniauxia marginata]
MAGKIAQKILDRIDAARAHRPGREGAGGGGGGHDHGHGRWAVESEERFLHHGGTYPRLCQLSDGSILCASTGFAGPVHILQVSRSVDGGRTFQPYSEVTRGAGDVDNAFLLEVPGPGTGTGGTSDPPTVLAAFRNHDRDPASRAYTHFRITVCRSLDGGRTWAFAAQAAEHAAAARRGLGLWEPFMRLDGDHRPGHVQLTYSAELAHDDQETFRVDSADGGLTWSRPPRCLRCHPERERLRDGMQGVASVRDSGRGHREALVMVFETTRRAPLFSVEYAVSYDGGRAWGDRGVVYCPRRPGRNAGAPQIAACGGGRIAVAFMTDEDATGAGTGAPVDWPRGAAVKVVFSDGLRGGRARWSERPVVVHGAPSFWPGILRTGDGEVMVVYEHAGKPRGRCLRWTG